MKDMNILVAVRQVTPVARREKISYTTAIPTAAAEDLPRLTIARIIAPMIVQVEQKRR